MKTVAVFGGSFNPPHIAHVLAATYVASLGICDHLVVAPVFAHAFEKELAPFEQRLELCRRAMGFIPGVEISDIESGLAPPSYTLNTLQALQRANPEWRLRLVVGADVLGETHKWHAFDQVQALAPLLVLGRVGYARSDAPDAVLPDVSSTRIRELLRSDTPAAQAQLAKLLPKAVRAGIREWQLYT